MTECSTTPAPGPRAIGVVRVLGSVVDDQTRCAHYGGETDVIALRFRCCGDYYPCYECHEESAGHPIARWRAGDADRLAVLCGVCRTELRIDEYLGASACPACGARFNPGCSLHHDIYFDFTTETP